MSYKFIARTNRAFAVRGSVLALGLMATALLIPLTSASRAAVMFSDNFNRANSSTVGNNWAEQNPGGGDVAIAGNALDALSNTGNDSGNSYVTQSMSNFAAGWNTVLTNNTSLITWTANMQSNNADMGGFQSGQEAIAFVLAATNSNLNSNGTNGYAIVWGDTSTTDSIRLVRFSNGLVADANLTNLLVANSGVPQDPGTNHMSVMVTYDPANDTFALFARSDGAAFVDPTIGSYASYGSIANTTFTSSTMSDIGLLGRYEKNNDDRLFDNVAVVTGAAAPEPASISALALAAIGMLRNRRRAV